MNEQVTTSLSACDHSCLNCTGFLEPSIALLAGAAEFRRISSCPARIGDVITCNVEPAPRGAPEPECGVHRKGRARQYPPINASVTCWDQQRTDC